MNFPEHVESFLKSDLLGERRTPVGFFRDLAVTAAEKDCEIEPGTNSGEIAQRFYQLFEKKLFYPSYEWMKCFANNQLDAALDRPRELLTGNEAPPVSLRNAEVLRFLQKSDPYLLEIPSNFLRDLERLHPWAIKYSHEPNASGQVPIDALWQALAEQLLKEGQPIMLFPESIRSRQVLDNPPGPMVRGVINLAKMIEDTEDGTRVAWNRLVVTIVDAVRLLDAMVGLTEDARGDGYIGTVRRIGLGMIGFGELCVRLGYPYASAEAEKLADKVAEFTRSALREATAALSEYRPVVTGAFVNVRGIAEPVRNLSRLYVLPEPELALIAGTTPGVEPLAGLAGRFVDGERWQSSFQISDLLMERLRRDDLVSERLMNELLDTGQLGPDAALPESVMELFATAGDLDAGATERIAYAFQAKCDDIVALRQHLPATTGEPELRRRISVALYQKMKVLWLFPRYAARGLHFAVGAP